MKTLTKIAFYFVTLSFLFVSCAKEDVVLQAPIVHSEISDTICFSIDDTPGFSTNEINDTVYDWEFTFVYRINIYNYDTVCTVLQNIGYIRIHGTREYMNERIEDCHKRPGGIYNNCHNTYFITSLHYIEDVNRYATYEWNLPDFESTAYANYVNEFCELNYGSDSRAKFLPCDCDGHCIKLSDHWTITYECTSQVISE